MTDSTLDDDDDPQHTLRQAALDHAWAWFALHARQRMQCVNFFLLAMAVLVAAFVTALKEESFLVAAAVGLLGAWITDCFHRLEIRTKELVKAGELAMEPLEQRLVQRVQVDALDIVRLVRKPGTEDTSYGHVLGRLYRTTLRVFLLGVGYALVRLLWRGLRYVEPWSVTDPSQLTGIALGLGFVAALMLAFLPPPHFSQYTKDGAAQITWTDRTTRWGTVLWWLSYSGPVLLAGSFAVQYLAWRASAG